MIGMKPRRIGFAYRKRAGSHPCRDRHRQLADIMGVRCPAQLANVRGRETHVLGSCIRERGNPARMAEREGHPHVDHVGDRQVGFLAALRVENAVGNRLQRQDRLAVDRSIDALEQARGVGKKEVGQLRLIGAAAALGPALSSTMAIPCERRAPANFLRPAWLRIPRS